MLEAYRLNADEQPTAEEQAYIALFGGTLHEVAGVSPSGQLVTAYGNSPEDAINRALAAGLQPDLRG